MNCVISRPAWNSFSRQQPVSIILCAVVVLSIYITSAFAGPNLVFDPRTGDVLYSAKAGDKWYPASLTKMMTAYLTFQALKKGELSLKTRLKVSKNASRQPPSKIGLRPGTRISVNKALEALIIRSANDIAVVLAEGVGKTEANFIKMMNAAAKDLGMDADSFTTVFDDAKKEWQELGAVLSVQTQEAPSLQEDRKSVV